MDSFLLIKKATCVPRIVYYETNINNSQLIEDIEIQDFQIRLISLTS